MKFKKAIYCNNVNCQDRELCLFGGKRTWNCKIIYGQGFSSSECPDFKPKTMEQAGLISEGHHGKN